jgi:hypothetical protein
LWPGRFEAGVTGVPQPAVVAAEPIVEEANSPTYRPAEAPVPFPFVPITAK